VGGAFHFWKSTMTVINPWDDGLDIPAYLRVENRMPLEREQPIEQSQQHISRVTWKAS